MLDGVILGSANKFLAWAVHYVDQGSYSVAATPGAKRKRAGSSGVDQAGDGDPDGEDQGALSLGQPFSWISLE